MKTCALIGLTLALFACSSDKDSSNTGTTDSGGADAGADGGADGGTDGGTDGSDGAELPPCENEIEATLPEDGDDDVYFRTTIEFTLDDPDPSAYITVMDSSGAEVPGSLSFNDEGNRVIFQPDAPLTALATYTASYAYCQDTQSPMAPTISFVVDDIGDPIECDLVGRTYAIELGSARFVEPEGVAELLLGEFEDDILIGVAAVGGGELNMLGAISEGAGGPQNYCNPSIDFPVASFDEDPYFAVGPTDINIDVAGVNIQISSLEITGSFRSDCSSFEGGTLAGELDARVLGPLLLDAIGTDDPDEICSLLLGFGVTCEACSSDGAAYCVDVYVDQMTAGEADMTLECIDETNCHELCGSNECADPAVGECE